MMSIIDEKKDILHRGLDMKKVTTVEDFRKALFQERWSIAAPLLVGGSRALEAAFHLCKVLSRVEDLNSQQLDLLSKELEKYE